MILLQTIAATANSENNFFEISTLKTLGGATMAVLLGSNALQALFNVKPKWPSFVISIIISYALAYHDSLNIDSFKYLVAFFNGLLIWSTAIGGNTLTNLSNNRRSEDEFQANEGRVRRFNDPWFK